MEAEFIIEDTKTLVQISEIDDVYHLNVTSIDTEVENVLFVNPEKTSHLQNEIIVIDSIISGIGRNKRKDIYRLIIEPVFELLGIKHVYFATKDKDSIKEFALSLDSNKERTVIFLSGDTTISEFINQLPEVELEVNINFIIIPCGTGNSLSLSLGIDNPINAVMNILQGSKLPLNLYEADFPNDSCFMIDEVRTAIKDPLIFLIVLSWAFHASIVADSDTKELRKFGIDRFKMAAMKNLEHEQNYRGSVKFGDTLIEGPFAYWLVTGATRFEPTFEILPRGDITNDSLYMVAVKSTNGDYLLDIMKEVYDRGRHIHDEKVIYREITKGQQIKLKLGADSKRFCLDGSIIILPESECEILIKSVGNMHKNWRINIIK